jgi:thiol-disulfide isomerase/thioredoxin
MRYLWLITAMLLLTVPAWAFTPEPGLRAYPLIGHDLVSGRQVDIESYRGKWVLLEFFATWCEPCVVQMPLLEAQARPWREHGQLELLAVSVDSSQSLGALRKLIRRQRIDHPVLWFGPTDDAWGGLEWEINLMPVAYLIDPQGVIVYRIDERFQLLQALSHFIDQHPGLPVPSIEFTGKRNSDDSVRLELRVDCPDHQPVDVMINVRRNIQEYWAVVDGVNQRIADPPSRAETNHSTTYPLQDLCGPRHLVPDVDGVARLTLEIPPVERCWMLCFGAEVALPGWQEHPDQEPLTISTSHCLPMQDYE